MTEHKQLGERMRRARELSGMTQQEVATVLGITAAAISQYETGKRKVDGGTVSRLIRLYAVPSGVFFGEDEALPDWESALRRAAKPYSAEVKAGVGHLISLLRNYEDLYRKTETPLPDPPRQAFEPLPDRRFSAQEAEASAERARVHFGLGVAPVPNLRKFLESENYQVFAVSLGKGGEGISGLLVHHFGLGPIITLNYDEDYARRSFTLAHEFAHGLFHHDRPAILCRCGDRHAREMFADRFAAAFLIPLVTLYNRLEDARIDHVRRADEVVHLARYFGVSYQAMVQRLKQVKLIDHELAEQEVKPLALARSLGYQPSRNELDVRPLSPEERFPRRYIELANQALFEERYSFMRIAEILEISDLELHERLDEIQESDARLELYA